MLARALDLMLIDTSADASGLMIAAAGRVTWHAGRRWTTISLDLSGFSPRKRSLIAGAIAKAARYTR